MKSQTNTIKLGILTHVIMDLTELSHGPNPEESIDP